MQGVDPAVRVEQGASEKDLSQIVFGMVGVIEGEITGVAEEASWPQSEGRPDTP